MNTPVNRSSHTWSHLKGSELSKSGPDDMPGEPQVERRPDISTTAYSPALTPAPPLTPSSLPPESRHHCATPDLTKPLRKTYNSLIPRTPGPTTPPAPAPEVIPPLPKDEPESTCIDLTSEVVQSTNDETLTLHIHNNATIVFLPQPPCKPRVRAFGICNTIERFFAQAYQAKLFAHEGSLGRLLEIKISTVAEAIGIADGDKEDFDDFVQELKKAPCWKRKEDGSVEGECKVEVRLQLL
jgi:hypothetical protein